MGKNRKDAVGGHAKRFVEIAGVCGQSEGFKRFARDRSNRMLRRQNKVAQKQALLDYEDEQAEVIRMQTEWDSYYDDYVYDDYLDDLEQADRDHEFEEKYEREMRYEMERELDAFIYERDYNYFDLDY